MKEKIYIQLNKKKLLISKLKKDGNKFFLKNPKTFNVETSQNNKIFNLSSIYIQIKKYLEKNKCKKTNSIVCSPQISNPNNLLQLTLVCSKANLLIEKIIDKSLLKKEGNMTFFFNNDLKNQLDFFKKIKPPTKRFPFLWITTTTFSFLIVIFIQFQIQKLEKQKLNYLNNKIKTIKVQNKKLKKILKQTHSLQAKNKRLNNKKKLLQKKQYNPNNILVSISQAIPKNCWLENIKIDFSSKKATRKSGKIILFQGKAFENKDILNFTKKLSLNNLIKNIKIKNIKKEKNEAYTFNLSKNKIYSFKIFGIIN